MKLPNYFSLVSLFCLTVISSCNYFSAASTTKLEVNKEPPSVNKIKAYVDQPISRQEDKLFLIFGMIYVENNEIELEKSFWGNEIYEANSYNEEIVKLDLMNCAGYIASATTTYKGITREVKIVPETIAKDAVEKIKQCAGAPSADGTIFGSSVFGISPSEDRRKTIKVGKIDTKKLYKSLIADIKEAQKSEKERGIKLASRDDVEPQLIETDEVFVSAIKATKGDLSLLNDNWTDLDGDGQIDLVHYYDQPCEEKDTCTWIFRLIDGKWKAIDYVSPL